MGAGPGREPRREGEWELPEAALRPEAAHLSAKAHGLAAYKKGRGLRLPPFRRGPSGGFRKRGTRN